MEHAAALAESLPPRSRLALAYAPRAERGRVLSLLALDARLGATVRQVREPLLAQVRLAWWRDRLGEECGAWPRGEPLLAALRSWQGGHGALAAMVDGWEALAASPSLDSDAIAAMAEARAAGFAALAGETAESAEATRMAGNWALADIALHLSDPVERGRALELAEARDWSAARLPRGLRPLAVLHALAAHDLRALRNGDKTSARALLVAMRAGLFGR